MRYPLIQLVLSFQFIIFAFGCKGLKEQTATLSEAEALEAFPGQIFLQGVDPGVANLFRGKTQPIAEWEPLSTVIISGSVLDFRFGYELLQKLLLTGLRGIIFVGVNNPELLKKFKQLVGPPGTTQFIGISTQAIIDHPSLWQKQHTVWSRDYGPIMARGTDGSPRMFNFKYARGDRELDDQFNTALLESIKTKAPTLPVGMKFEGGNFMTDGETCIYSDVVLQHGYNLKDVDGIFRNYMGCKKIITMPAVAHEGTGHVDMVMKFVRKNEVVLAQLFRNPNPTPEEHALNLDVKKSLDRIHTSLVKAGIKVTRIPMPAVRIIDYTPVFFSYTNSLISNGHIIMPVYGKDIDGDKAKQAIDIYKSFNYTVQTLDSKEIIVLGGAVHCSTMQIPAYQKAWHDQFYDELRRRRLL